MCFLAVILQDWNRIINEAYTDYMKDIDPQDTAACDARMKPIRDDLHRLGKDNESSQIPPATRMRTAIQQLTLIVGVIRILVSHN